MKHWTQALTRPYLLLALGAVIGAAVVVAMVRDARANQPLVYQPQQRTGLQTSAAGPVSDLKGLDQLYTELSSYASEAVVHIAVQSQGSGPFMTQVAGDGSGFILTSDGWIVTNDHVVQNSKKVKVILADGRELDGEVHPANDADLDIALVKVNATNLPVLKFGDSDGVKPGQIVIAVGSPFGLDNTVTFGHISAIGRRGRAGDGFTDVRDYSGMIQTDASINPGNSGGPLINIDGEVVGVNTSIYSTSGASAGIGFAIPANVVQAVANELKQTGKFDRGLIGLYPRDLKGFESKELGLSGAYVEDVEPDNPAQKAGLLKGDVITKFNEKPITNEIDLRVQLYESSPNQKVNVTYVRDGKPHTTQVTLKAPVINKQPQQPQQPRFNRQNPFNGPDFGQPDQGQGQGQQPRLGVMLQDVDDTTRDQYHLPAGLAGAVVYGVSGGSYAEKAGLQEGDVITAFGAAKVSKAEDVVNQVGKLHMGDEVVIKFLRMESGKAVEKTVRIRFR